MKWILLVALWTPDGLRAEGYEYRDRATCEQVSQKLISNIEGEAQVLEIWCYAAKPYSAQGEVEE